MDDYLKLVVSKGLIATTYYHWQDTYHMLSVQYVICIRDLVAPMYYHAMMLIIGYLSIMLFVCI